MDNIAIFDTLKFTKTLITEKHAEAHSKALSNSLKKTIATKFDILDLKNEINNLKTEFKLKPAVKTSGYMMSFLRDF